MSNEEDVSARLNKLERRVEKLERYIDGGGAASTAKGKKMSAKEFLITKNVKTDTQKALALAFFLERMEGVASFNVSDLEAVFRLAREKVPTNMNDVVNKNIARGFVMEAKERKDSKKAWHLTSTGEQHVENEMK